MPGLIKISHTVIAAINRHGVLHQIVGADAEKIDQFGQMFHHQRRGRRLHHCAKFKMLNKFLVFPSEVGLKFGDNLLNLADFLHAADHRQHHPQIAVNSGAQQCPELGPQRVAPLAQRQTDAAQPQKRIAFRITLKFAIQLIAADVESSNDQRLIAKPFQQFAVNRQLLILSGRSAAVDKHIFGAEQSDPARPGTFDHFQIVNRLNIAGKLHHEPVLCLRTQFRLLRQRSQKFVHILKAFFVKIARLRRRIGNQNSGVSVDDCQHTRL